ncbi:MAG TPA: multicopper oxidase domain-containing protein [Chloroflexota bacterium]|nr:multicopper oxidase domain-containing protein [Chloroflexota bacterium]
MKNSSDGSHWYHDHAMGTRAERIYRGLAGFYLIRARTKRRSAYG